MFSNPIRETDVLRARRQQAAADGEAQSSSLRHFLDFFLADKIIPGRLLRQSRSVSHPKRKPALAGSRLALKKKTTIFLKNGNITERSCQVSRIVNVDVQHIEAKAAIGANTSACEN